VNLCVALAIHHAVRVRLIFFCGLPLQYFSTLSHNGTIFEKKKVIEHNNYIQILSATFA